MPGSLERYFDAHRDGPGIHKWRHYFPIYERHLHRFVGTDAHMVEIGVHSGGSLGMWRHYLGDRAQIYRVDIEDACRRFQARGTEIVIGDQADPRFWAAFISDRPRVDIVLDDGGHEPNQQIATLKALLPHLAPAGVYICEDIHDAFQPFHAFIDGLGRPLSEIHTGRADPSPVHQHVASIHRYPLMTVIEKPAATVGQFEAVKRGSEWMSF